MLVLMRTRGVDFSSIVVDANDEMGVIIIRYKKMIKRENLFFIIVNG